MKFLIIALALLMPAAVEPPATEPQPFTDGPAGYGICLSYQAAGQTVPWYVPGCGWMDGGTR